MVCRMSSDLSKTLTSKPFCHVETASLQVPMRAFILPQASAKSAKAERLEDTTFSSDRENLLD
eukprot:7069426-Prorocentrum_lima.AAC.1